jgi:hypothetical protein
MTFNKQVGVVALAAVAVALLVYSYFASFLSGPKPAPPEAGEKWKQIMKRQIEAQREKDRARQAGQSSHSPAK